MAATVQLNSPLTGDSVQSTFTATGVWNGDPPVVRIRYSNGTTPSPWYTVQQQGVDSGTWQYTFNNVPPATGYSVETELVSASDPNTVLSSDAADEVTVGGMPITITDAAVSGPGTAGEVQVRGTVTAGPGYGVACALVRLTRPRAQLKFAALVFVTPDGSEWSCVLPPPPDKRLWAVRAFLLAPDGSVVGATSSRLKGG